MKSLKIFLFSFLLLSAQTLFAQTKTESLKVAGACGMCKTKIESAAKKAGATYAVWNEDSKDLVVKYNSTSSNTAKIQKNIAKAGYDTKDFKATDEAYNQLHSCCKYDRDEMKAECCGGAQCKEVGCMKDGKCTKDASCCKAEGCTDKECCKKENK